MAISMSEAQVDQSEREALKGMSITSSDFGGEEFNTTRFLQLPTGAPLAGVTEAFATNFQLRAEEYRARVQAAIDELQKVSSEEAFRGTSVAAGLNNFIDSVKSVAGAYLNKLVAAENQIAISVQKAYQTQDDDLSGQLQNDSANLGGQAPTGSI